MQLNHTASDQSDHLVQILPPEENGSERLHQLIALGAQYRAEGRHLVLTNGCFDLLYTGHVRYLQQARALGDGLLVAINSDRSVKELKGASRPLNQENDRAEIVAALRCVDHVTIFDNLRVTEVIRAVRPSVYVKGGDYSVETLDQSEREALQECGAEVKIVSLIPDRSTTRLLEKMK